MKNLLKKIAFGLCALVIGTAAFGSEKGTAEEATAMVPFAWVIEAKLVLNEQLMKKGAETRAARIASEQQQQTTE